MFIEQ